MTRVILLGIIPQPTCPGYEGARSSYHFPSAPVSNHASENVNPPLAELRYLTSPLLYLVRHHSARRTNRTWTWRNVFQYGLSPDRQYSHGPVDRRADVRDVYTASLFSGNNTPHFYAEGSKRRRLDHSTQPSHQGVWSSQYPATLTVGAGNGAYHPQPNGADRLSVHFLRIHIVTSPRSFNLGGLNAICHPYCPAATAPTIEYLRYSPPTATRHETAASSELTPTTLACPHPKCSSNFGRQQELERHVREHLPPYIYCSYPKCAWRKKRRYMLGNHWQEKHPGVQAPDPGNLEQYIIYDVKRLVKQLINKEITFEEARVEVDSSVLKKALESGKQAVWGL
ncbi:hypothetical protein B0F90DRAFT_1815663 [Multifurca ochricompacta]|uniref:C2H2-type domain-containing protein n=1 Tax=Multifurca ochricompacta TaxID=376703 RepID=A0AAD4M6V2_9AGAM|nr:hypothetical protein B0F90DRAFT_1815663 [Multifurca ochricompacta]